MFWKNESDQTRTFGVWNRHIKRDNLYSVAPGAICEIPDEFEYIIEARGLHVALKKVGLKEAANNEENLVKGVPSKREVVRLLEGVENPAKLEDSQAVPELLDTGAEVAPENGLPNEASAQLKAQGVRKRN